MSAYSLMGFFHVVISFMKHLQMGQWFWYSKLGFSHRRWSLFYSWLIILPYNRRVLWFLVCKLSSHVFLTFKLLFKFFVFFNNSAHENRLIKLFNFGLRNSWLSYSWLLKFGHSFIVPNCMLFYLFKIYLFLLF